MSLNSKFGSQLGHNRFTTFYNFIFNLACLKLKFLARLSPGPGVLGGSCEAFVRNTGAHKGKLAMEQYPP